MSETPIQPTKAEKFYKLAWEVAPRFMEIYDTARYLNEAQDREDSKYPFARSSDYQWSLSDGNNNEEYDSALNEVEKFSQFGVKDDILDPGDKSFVEYVSTIFGKIAEKIGIDVETDVKYKPLLVTIENKYNMGPDYLFDESVADKGGILAVISNHPEDNCKQKTSVEPVEVPSYQEIQEAVRRRREELIRQGETQ